MGNAQRIPVERHPHDNLHRAAGAGDAETIRSILNSLSPSFNDILNSRDDYGDTPLHAAVFNGHEKCAYELLMKGADSNAEGNRQYSPLHLACLYGKKNCVKLLLDFLSPSQLEKTGENGQTPLHLAALRNRKDIIELLLQKGANPNAGDFVGRSPLHYCILSSISDSLSLPAPFTFSSVSLLLHSGAVCEIVDSEGQSPLSIACEFASISLMELILQRVDLDSPIYQDLLHNAVKGRRGEVVKCLLEWGFGEREIRREGRDETILQLATHLGDDEIVNVIINHQFPVKGASEKDEN